MIELVSIVTEAHSSPPPSFWRPHDVQQHSGLGYLACLLCQAACTSVRVRAPGHGYAGEERRKSGLHDVNTPSVTVDASHRAELGLIPPPGTGLLTPDPPPGYAATYPGTGAAPDRRGRIKWWINFTSAGFYGDDLTIHECRNSCDSGGP